LGKKGRRIFFPAVKKKRYKKYQTEKQRGRPPWAVGWGRKPTLLGEPGCTTLILIKSEKKEPRRCLLEKQRGKRGATFAWVGKKLAKKGGRGQEKPKKRKEKSDPGRIRKRSRRLWEKAKHSKKGKSSACVPSAPRRGVKKIS